MMSSAWNSKKLAKHLPILNKNVLLVLTESGACRPVLLNLFVIVEPPIYFRVSHRTPINKNFKNTNYL